MKGIMKKTIIMLLMLSMVLCVNIGIASADTSNLSSNWEVIKYELYNSAGKQLTGANFVEKGTLISAWIYLQYTGGEPKPASASDMTITRAVDNFDGGTAPANNDQNRFIYDASTRILSVCITDLKYDGVGTNLSFRIQTNSDFQTIDINCKELKKWTEPTTPTIPDVKPEPVIPEPYGLFTRGQISDVIRANEEFDLTINIKNRGKTTMLNPVATVELSDCLMNMTGQDSFGMLNILSGSTGTITLKVKAMSAITSQAQFANVSLRFDYNNGTNITAGNTSGKVTIPCKLSTEAQSDKADSPVPNMIVTKFNYGSNSVAAGSDFTFGFTFKNTSRKIDTENIVVTVESAGFTPNGSSNTLYFPGLDAGETKTVTLPMKANSVFEGATQDIAVNFSYEYVDKKVRHPMTSSIKISVPVYQKDRFEISSPLAPAVCYEGEEISLTMDYVNKGKSAANNVEATIEGDVTSPNPTQILGNIEPGKNGQFAFALTPLMVGECNFTITVTYEDANENIMQRTFPVTLNVEAMQWEDPGEMEDPGMEDMPQEKSNLWKYLVAVAILALIVLLVVLRKRKKAKAIKNEESQWKAWEEEFAKEEAGSEKIDTSNDKAVDEKVENREKKDK